jgi:hypothetical protein
VIRVIFGPKTGEVIGGFRKLRNDLLHNLYCSPYIIRLTKSKKLSFAGHVARMGGGGGRKSNRILIAKPEGKRPLGGSKHKQGKSIIKGLRKVGFGALIALISLRVGTSSGYL